MHPYRNPCILVAQLILTYCFIARDDSLNVLRLSALYIVSCMPDGVQIGPRAFLARQLYGAAVSTKDRIVIGGVITTIARFLGVEPILRIEFLGPSGLIKSLLS